MSLLLSILGSTAMLGATAVVPIAALTPSHQQEEVEAKEIKGVYNFNKKLEAQATAGNGTVSSSIVQDTKFASFRVSWANLGVTTDDWFNIDWTSSWFTLNMDIMYKNNGSGSNGELIKKQEHYEGDQLGMAFIQPTKLYEDGRPDKDATGRIADHTWEYIFSDNGLDLILDAKVWVLARNNNAWSYASINFDSLIYSIALKA